MLVFFAALIIMMLTCVSIIWFLIWAFRQWRTAEKYRYLIRLHQAMPPAHVSNKGGGQHWTVTYKEKGKLKTVSILGTTEGEALKTFVKNHSVGYANIVSCEKS